MVGLACASRRRQPIFAPPSDACSLMREPIFSSLAQHGFVHLDEPGGEHLRQRFHLGHGVIVNIGEAAEFMRPLDLVMRSAKLVAKCENDGLSGLGKMWDDPSRMDRQIEDGGTSLICRKDDRVPFVVGVEAQMVEEEIADFAVPAIILNEPERAQTNVVVTLRQRLGLELTDAFVTALRPSSIIRATSFGVTRRLAGSSGFAPILSKNEANFGSSHNFGGTTCFSESGVRRRPKPKMAMSALLSNVTMQRNRSGFPAGKGERAMDAARLTICWSARTS